MQPHFIHPVSMDKSAYTYQKLYASLSNREYPAGTARAHPAVTGRSGWSWASVCPRSGTRQREYAVGQDEPAAHSDWE